MAPRQKSPTPEPAPGAESVELAISRAGLERSSGIDADVVLTAFWLGRLSRRFASWRQGVYKEAGMEATDAEIVVALRVVGTEPDQPLTWIRETMRFTSGGVTRAVDRLVAAGLLERRQDDEDRRGVRLRLTDAGRNQADAIIASVAARQSEVLAGMSRVGVRSLLASLDEMLELYADVPLPP